MLPGLPEKNPKAPLKEKEQDVSVVSLRGAVLLSPEEQESPEVMASLKCSEEQAGIHAGASEFSRDSSSQKSPTEASLAPSLGAAVAVKGQTLAAELREFQAVKLCSGTGRKGRTQGLLTEVTCAQRERSETLCPLPGQWPTEKDPQSFLGMLLAGTCQPDSIMQRWSPIHPLSTDREQM